MNKSKIATAALSLSFVVPLAALAADKQGDAVPSIQIKRKPGKGVVPPPPRECKLVETGKSICEKNAYGDEVCQPEIVEQCVQPI